MERRETTEEFPFAGVGFLTNCISGSPAKLLSRQREQSIQSQRTRGGTGTRYWAQSLVSGCGNRGLASPMSFHWQSDHRRGGRWPSLAKPWRSGIVQDQNERKLELPLGPLRESHPQLGRGGMCLVSVRPTQRERVCPSAQPGSRELLGRAVQSWLRKTTVLATHTRSPESALRGPPQPTFPQNQRKPAGCWILTWHRVPAAENGLRAPTRPPFIHLRPPVRGGGETANSERP